MRELQLVADSDNTRTDAVTDWIARGCAAIFFLVVGLEKLSTNPDGSWVKLFDAIGFGQWFRYFTGALQVGGAGLLLIPCTATIGATILACTMLGAVATHFYLGDPFSGIIPGAFLVALVILVLRSRRVRREGSSAA
jgi:putative oxidoreductase